LIYKKEIRSTLTAGAHHRIPGAKWTGCYSECEAKRQACAAAQKMG